MSSYEKSIKLYGEVGDYIGEVSYVDNMGDDKKIINAARVSYGKEIEEIKEKDVTLLKYLMDNKHTSPFEHCSVTFRFSVPLFVRSQHMRHRTWAFNEKSRRYSSEDIKFYEPQSFRSPHKEDIQASNEEKFDPDMSKYSTQSAYNLICEHHDRSFRLYDALLDAGVAREMARGVLPQNLYTEYYGTCNLHNLMNFLNLRNSEHAQYEIRQVAKAIQEILCDLFPITMKLFLDKSEDI
ncbi:MAG: FAD-dependent thymidylate synthase [Nanoarchaeota archaeon]|nr:FAD-dependent thymidylate synthase [Nanoarchaeota archaeon]